MTETNESTRPTQYVGYVPKDEDELLGITESHEPPPPRASATIACTRRPPYRLCELYERPELLEPPPAIIPGIAYAGRVTLISGREKSGKSTVMGQALSALSRGDAFLGEPLPIARSLIYTIDEPLGDTVLRYKQFRAHPEEIAVQTERPTADDMRAEIEATGADVVVVDTLSEWWRGKIRSENDSSETGPFLRPFVEVVRETNVALVLLYHTTKSGAGYRGSGDIGAIVDIILTLRQPSTAPEQDGAWDDIREDDGRRVLEGKGRGGVKVNLRLHFDGLLYSIGDAQMPLRGRILAELAHDPASGSALAELLGARKDRVLMELRDLRAEGMVEQRGKSFQLSPRGKASVPMEKAREPMREPIAGAIRPELTPREPGRNRSGTDAGTDASSIGSRGNTLAHSREPIAGTDRVRVIERDGRQVQQVLRLTQHGEKWFDQDAA